MGFDCDLHECGTSIYKLVIGRWLYEHECILVGHVDGRPFAILPSFGLELGTVQAIDERLKRVPNAYTAWLPHTIGQVFWLG